MISSSKKYFIAEYRPHCIRLIQASSTAAPIAIEAVQDIHLGQEVEEIANLVRKFSGAKANGYMNGTCVVYPDRRIVRQLTVDAPKEKEADYVLNQIQSGLKDSEEIAAHCLSPLTGEEVDPAQYNKKAILVCGIPRNDILVLQQQMLDHGIYPDRIELGTVGSIGALQDILRWQGKSSPILFLELEESFTNAIIIGPKGVEMSRRVETGSAEIASSLKTELNLKDEKAAMKLLESQDFDLGSISKKILRNLLRDLQSSIGFYEVQTGQSVGWIHAATRASSINWFQKSVGESLSLEPLQVDIGEWLKSKGVELSVSDSNKPIDLGWLGVFSSLCEFRREEAVV